MSRILGLTGKAFLFLIVFTVVEVVTLVYWLVLAGIPLTVTTQHILAVVVLVVGLFIEHYLSLRAGKYNTF
jgi:hypothetical protein